MGSLTCASPLSTRSFCVRCRACVLGTWVCLCCQCLSMFQCLSVPWTCWIRRGISFPDVGVPNRSFLGPTMCLGLEHGPSQSLYYVAFAFALGFSVGTTWMLMIFCTLLCFVSCCYTGAPVSSPGRLGGRRASGSAGGESWASFGVVRSVLGGGESRDLDSLHALCLPCADVSYVDCALCVVFLSLHGLIDLCPLHPFCSVLCGISTCHTTFESHAAA